MSVAPYSPGAKALYLGPNYPIKMLLQLYEPGLGGDSKPA